MMDEKRSIPGHIIIKRPKVKDKERLLYAREKKLVTSRLPDGRGRGRMGEEVRGLSTNRQLQYRHGDLKYSIGNGEAKELIYIKKKSPCMAKLLTVFQASTVFQSL